MELVSSGVVCGTVETAVGVIICSYFINLYTKMENKLQGRNMGTQRCYKM